jgi:hypothetical protein
MKRTKLSILFVSATAFALAAGPWRAATSDELKQVIPARAQVEKERIETEFRTASGITDGDGKFIAGVVLITAGYAAEGKYSNYFIVQASLKVEDLTLPPGNYVFGWKHDTEDSLRITFYDAASGQPLGTAEAKRTSRAGKIESFRISPPGAGARIQIGRFAMPYSIAQTP